MDDIRSAFIYGSHIGERPKQQRRRRRRRTRRRRRGRRSSNCYGDGGPYGPTFPLLLMLVGCGAPLHHASQMLRPKQLLPLLKASQRTWLVAGSTSGTRAGDGTNHPHGLSAADDREGENGRKPSSSILSSGHLQGVGGFGSSPPMSSGLSGAPGRSPLPFHTAPIPGQFIKESVGDGTLPGSTVLDQYGQPDHRVVSAVVSGSNAAQLPQKVGFAAVGGLSSVEAVLPTAGNRTGSFRLPNQQSPPAPSSCNLDVAQDRETKDVRVLSSEREVPLIPAGKGVHSSNGSNPPQKTGNYNNSHYGVGTPRAEWQARSSQPKPSTFNTPAPRPWTPTNNPLRQVSGTPLSRQLSPGSTVDSARNDAVPQNWSSKERSVGTPTRGGQGGRSQAGNKRYSQKSASESRAVNGEVVDHVCNILRQLNWRPDTLVALSHVNRTLSTYHINEVLKHQKEAGLAKKFFDWAKGQDGYRHDVCTFTTMIGILGRARDFEACTQLLEEMRGEGCVPCVVTYNRLIHAYGRANYLGEAVRIFHQMQEDGCKPDRVTYCTLVDLHSKAGFHDIAMDMYRQMQQAGFQPDTFAYSVIIHCLGKANKANAALKLFQEMIERGCAPSLVTYNIIIDLHAKAGNYVMAMKLYNDMQDAGFHPDRVTYSIMMEVLGQAGHIGEAEQVFREMEQAGWIPDAPIYGAMVDMWGKTGNADKAQGWYQKMLDSGLTPNVQVSNSLLGTYLRMHRFDSAREVLESMNAWGLVPTLQTYTILLSSLTASSQHQQVVSLFSSPSHPVYTLVYTLLSREVPFLELKPVVRQFFESFHGEAHDCKRGFTDAFIEFLHNLGRRAEAGVVWDVAREFELYPQTVREKAKNQYSINLHVMSMGTALVALSQTLSGFRENMLSTGIAPERIEIITGWGKHSRVTGSSLVRHSVYNLLRALSSPFYVDSSNTGCFVSHGKSLSTWLHQPYVEHMLLL